MDTLVLITSQFPFGTGEPFLETELPIVSSGFDKIIIIAQDTRLRQTRHIPEQYKILRYSTATTISGYLRLPVILLVNLKSLCKIYNQELSFRRKRAERLPIKHRYILIKKIIKGLQLKDFIQKLQKNGDIPGRAVFYSYWLKTGAHAIAMLRCKNCIKISRAHGSDLYEERNVPSYLPLLSFVSDNLDAIFFVSEDGLQYFKNKTGTNKSGFILSRLGVTGNSANSVKINKKTDIFNIVSCSNIIGLKRIDLIISGLELIGNGRRVHWVHFGDGILRQDMENLAAEKLGNKKNITYSFMGQYPNARLLDYYGKNIINLFINTSSAEGVPVSIMEAQSFGIPVIATDVGGVREVVAEGTGILLPVNFRINELASHIEQFIDMSLEDESAFRNNALHNWEDNFNASSNYHGFITKLNSILASSSEL